ncbi:MAG: putative Ig domain-containing protein [Desulforhopalus sp.]
MKSVFFLVYILFFSVLTPLSEASEVTVFNDLQFTRTTGAPNLYSKDFTATPGEAILTIRNGEPGATSNSDSRITSGVITLNGEILFDHDDFKHQTYILEIPVTLLGSNSLLIELESKPDSYISVEIVQTTQDPVYDVLATDLVVDTTHCPDSVDIEFRLDNSGSATVPAGLQIAFYNGDPKAGGYVIGTTETTTELPGLGSEIVMFQWENPFVEEAVIYVSVDDDGKGTALYEELDEANNIISAETMLCPITPGDSNLSGHIINAINGNLLPGVTTLLLANNNGTPGAVVASVESDSEGVFIFTDLSAGSYFISAAHPGYIDNHRTVTLNNNTYLTNQDLTLSPVLNENEIRIILTWNGSPSDLEAHLTTPSEVGCRYHCYYFNKTIPTANLDLDDRDGYGPETITITDRVSGTYRYYVHDFTNRLSNSRALSLSGATVKVFYGDREPIIFTVPYGYGNGWHVFDMDGETGEITPIHNLIRQSEPGRIDYPVILSGTPSRYAYWGSTYKYQVIAADPDNDKLTYSLENQPTGMTINPDTGLLVWAPSGNQVGWYYNIKIKVEDGRCGEATKIFKVYVNSNPTINFSVSPCSGFNPGGNITFTWTTTRATTVLIDQGVGEVPPSGTVTIPSPEVPTPYTLTAFNDAALIKKIAPTPPGASFYFSPRYIDIGASTTLNWNSSCSTSRSISHGIGSVPISGSQVVTPTKSGYYYLTASNGGGTNSIRTYISVRYPPDYFDISPRCNMTPGEPMTLSWNINNAENVSIYPEIGIVEATGFRVVNPTESGTYSLNATVDGRPISRSVTFPDLPAIDTSPRNSAGVNLGQSINLRYWSQCADKVSFNQGIGEVAANGTISVTPESLPQTYTVTATNERGSRSRSVKIYQVAPQLSVSPYRHYMDPGDKVTVNWSSLYADTVSFNQGIGEVLMNGSLTVAPENLPITYTLTATNSAGSTLRRVYLYPIAPRGTLTADPTIMKVGDSTTLTWTSDRASSCSITPDIGPVALNGSMTITPTRPTQYRLTVQGPSGTHNSYVNVGFVSPIADLKASSSTINQGESVKLTWVYANATGSTIDQGIGQIELGGERTVAPETTTTYTMTAIGPGGTTRDSVTINVIPSGQAPIINLSSSPGNIIPTQSSVLSWDSSYTQTLNIEPDIGTVANTGSMTVSPEKTTTYTATATGSGGTNIARAVVNVIHSSPTLSLWFEPATILAGEATLLNWSGSDAETIFINQGIGEVPLQGSMTLTPEATTLYTATVSGPGGTITKNISITVIQPPPTATITASQHSIDLGESTILSWNTENAETVVIRPGVGAVDSSGSLTVSPIEDTTYYITASGQGGLVTQQTSITVIYPEPTATLTVNPADISAGENSTLTWSTEYAHSCSIEPNIGMVACSGELAVAPSQDTTYTLTATGPGGTSIAKATILVPPINPLSLTITSPIDGATLRSKTIQVTGTIYHANEGETGVVVNGVTALVYNNRFVASHVPLFEGTAMIAVTAVDVNGEQIEESVNVFSTIPSRHVELILDIETGVAPLETTLRLDTNFNPSSTPLITYMGPAELGLNTGVEADSWDISATQSGLYTFNVEAVDEMGETYTDEVSLLIMNKSVFDNMIHVKWDRMKAAMAIGDIEETVKEFTLGQRGIFREILTVQSGKLSQIAAEMQDIEFIDQKNNTAEYRIRRDLVFQGSHETITFYIYFDREVDGIWRIRDF